MGNEKRRMRRSTKAALWIGVLGPILPLAFDVFIGYAYLAWAVGVFLLSLSVLRWIANGLRAPSTLLGLVLSGPEESRGGIAEDPMIPEGQGLIHFYRPRMHLTTALPPFAAVHTSHCSPSPAETKSLSEIRQYPFMWISSHGSSILSESPMRACTSSRKSYP